jgi:hypothetical protein
VVKNENNNHTVTFNDKDQIVKYNVTIENTSGYELKVDEIDLTKPTKDFLVYELKGISTGDVIKSNETKELVISLETTETNNLGNDFNDELLATINFEKSVTNPFTSTKGLIAILLAAAIVTGVCIIIYRNNKDNNLIWYENFKNSNFYKTGNGIDLNITKKGVENKEINNKYFLQNEIDEIVNSFKVINNKSSSIPYLIKN